MADMVSLVNTILSNATTEYSSRVPLATQTNIADVAAPILEYSSTQNEFLNALVNKIGMTVVRNRTINNPLQILKSGAMPLGKDIEEIFTNPATGEHFDPTGAGLLTQKTPEVYSCFHRLNRQDQYTVTISKQQLQQAFVSWADLEALLNTITNSLYSGDNYDEFILMKNLIADTITNNKIVQVETGDISTDAGRIQFVKDMRNASSYFQFPSSNFNVFHTLKAAEVPPVVVNPVITWTPIEDQIVLIRTDVLTEINVEVLSAAFNMDKADFIARKVEVDSFGAAENTLAIVCDKAFFQVYDNLTEMTEFFNAKALAYNYYWNHWQTYSTSLFANAIAFNYTPPVVP